MSDLRKAAQEALEALEYITKDSFEPFGIPLPGEIDITMDALRAALAQPDESFCDSHCTWLNHHPYCEFREVTDEP